MYDERYQDHQRRLSESRELDRGCLRGLAIAALIVLLAGLFVVGVVM